MSVRSGHTESGSGSSGAKRARLAKGSNSEWLRNHAKAFDRADHVKLNECADEIDALTKERDELNGYKEAFRGDAQFMVHIYGVHKETLTIAEKVLSSLRLALQVIHPSETGVLAKWRTEIEEAVRLQDSLVSNMQRARPEIGRSPSSNKGADRG